MPIIPLSLDILDSQIHDVLENDLTLQLSVRPPGRDLYDLLDAIKPSKIVETGCLRDSSLSSVFSDGWSTFYFAKWIRNNPQAELISIELELKNINLCRKILYPYELDKYVTFIQGDSIQKMNELGQVDFFFLDSCDGLEHGLAEFKEALKHQPKLIVMDDWQTKIVLAAEYAQENNIPFRQLNRYIVFTLPVDEHTQRTL